MKARLERRSVRMLVALTSVIAIAAGCGRAPTASPTAMTAVETPAPPSASELEAIRFRTENSLQADLAHVRAVAADPTARMEFGVPLLPSEVDELLSRSSTAEDIIAIVQAEAASAPGDYCGIYLDNANEGAVTSLWKANRLVHELAIRAKVRPGGHVAFRDCRFSEVEQDAAMDAIRSADDAWIRAIPAALRGYGFATSSNVLEMQISSAVPNAATVVREGFEDRLGLPPGMLLVTSDGTGAALRPWGTLHVFVLGPDGAPVGVALGLNWVSTDLPGLECGSGDVGYGVPSDGGPADLPCQEGTWNIQVWQKGVEDVIGRGTIQVHGGKTAELTIRLTRAPDPNGE